MRLQGTAAKGTVPYAQLNEALVLLIGKGDVVAVQDDAVTQRAQPLAADLNQYLIQLASPVSGGGIAANRFEQLFLLCLHESPAGAPPDAPALAEPTAQATAFLSKRLPLLGRMGVTQSLRATL